MQPLPELKGVDLLRKFCLHPSNSTREKNPLHRGADRELVSQVSTQPPSSIRVFEETRGNKKRPADVYSKFLLSHPEDRPWRRGPKDLPLWDKRETLNNKAATLTSKISSDFCEWYRSLGGTEVITEEKVADLFAIRIPPYEPSKSLTRRPDPKSISGQAILNVQPRFSVKEATHMRRPSPKAPTITPPPEELKSLQLVFEDILQFDITQSYYQHLVENSQQSIPSFLFQQKHKKI